MVAVGILLVAMAVVGLTFRNGEYNVELAERMTRSTMMTERLLAEMETGILTMEEREQSGWFGDEGMPDMSWRVEISPHEQIKDLIDVDISIYMGDPDKEEERQLVLWTRVQRPKPRGLDPKYLGLTPEQIAALQALLSGAGIGFDQEDFHVTDFSRQVPREFRDMLPSLLPLLLSGSWDAGQIESISQAAQGGDLSGLQDLLQQLASQAPIEGEAGGSGTGAGEGGQAGQGSPGGGTSPSGGSQSGTGQPSSGGTRRGLRDRAGGGKQ